MELIKLEHIEFYRRYHYKDGDTTEFKNVIEFASGNTTHRLRLENGTLIIVPITGLKYIEIIAKDFTV